MSDGLSLLSLFASSFLSATLLPGNSEVVLVALLVSGVSHPWVLVLTATMGNSLGGLTNVILGRFFPLRKTSRWQVMSLHRNQSRHFQLSQMLAFPKLFRWDD